MNERKTSVIGNWGNRVKMILMAMIAEINITVMNVVNIFFVSRYLGTDGTEAYEVVLPCITVVCALIALGYILPSIAKHNNVVLCRLRSNRQSHYVALAEGV